MTKDVLVCVEGMQFSQQNLPEKVEIINPGNYYKKGDYHYVLYDETLEGFDQVTRNMLKFKDGEAYLRKKGVINVEMLFEENKKNSSCYATPFGDVLLDINTTSVVITQNSEQLLLEIGYDLEANYEALAQCRIRIRVCPKENGNILFS